MVRLVLFACVAFAAGHVIGFLLRPEPPPPRVEPAPKPVVRSVVTVESEPPPRVEGSFATLEEALDAIPVPAKPEGDGEIRGRVVDERGNPIAGATVTCMPHEARARWNAPLEEKVRTYIVRSRWQARGRVSAESDAEGRFRLRGLARIPYEVRARHEHYRMSLRRDFTVTPDAEFDIVGRPYVELPVTVLLPDGSKPDRAQVILRRGNHTSTNIWQPDGGNRIFMELGSWRVHASADGDPDPYVSKVVSVEVELGDRPPALTLQLERQTGVFGTVDFGGEPFGQAHVGLVRRRGHRRPSPRKFETARRAAIDKGAYRLIGVEPGSYWMALLLAEGVPVQLRPVEIGSEPSEQDFRVDGHGSEFFTVRVSDEGGVPISGARFQRRFGHTCFHVIGGPGLYHLPAFARGSHVLTVKQGHERQLRVPIEIPVAGEVHATFERLYEVRVLVPDPRPAWLQVNYFGTTTDEEGRRRAGPVSAALDADGHAVLRVPAGRWSIELSSGHGSVRSTAFAEKQVTVGNDMEMSLACPPLHPVVLEFEAAVAQVHIRQVGGNVGATLGWPFESRRKHEIPGLPAGRYRLEHKHYEAEFTVPAPKPIVLKRKE